ncbi:MAG: YfcC family protein [Eggerthellaceae bacterium]|nr:YfcC family protein [Eggerthellaceae bacterium]
MAAEKAKKRRTLSSFAILLIILLALAVITVVMYFSGVQGVEGATVAGVLTAPVQGFADALPVCLFVLVLGGFLGIVTETGALDAGIAALVNKLKGNELVLIPILMFVFSIGGTTYGMCEETVPFYLLIAATMVAAGFDSVVGAAVVLLGAGCGVLGSTVNPFAIGAAVDALSGTGLEINQGIVIALGAILWLSTLGLSIVFVMRYAKKVKADKGSTILSLQERDLMNETFASLEAQTASDEAALSAAKSENGVRAIHLIEGRQKAVLVVFAVAFIVMIIGFIPWEDLGVTFFSGAWSALLTGFPLGQWYFNEASTWFLLMALAAGIVGGLSESRFVSSFINGAAEMMSVVLVIALARSVTVLMGETGLDVWILEHAAYALEGVSAFVFAPLSYALYLVLSVLVPSSSGMATLSMPIMGPLASELGFSVEAMIVIFAAGNGLVNMITPTCAAIMGGLALVKVEYTTWVKFAAKLLVVLGLVSVVVLTFATILL